ncbi:hypothetical protein ARALYDRAFT_889818 [Arabidopsis lyrata subsp. lyrata]|uniref:F-box domain-containing protein n=1 Tax=Arabidopsis lyrata subsp. lyrata TaxID=81972 RepID=D7KMM2_ARALL|nr:hypothetical protein ARALYDRAFT_889818 [Arabidopsis lyrata subsp. lyrata]
MQCISNRFVNTNRFEIRLPAKSLMRFKCVSKLWLSLILSRYLTNRFLKPSPRSRYLAYFVDSEKHS